MAKRFNKTEIINDFVEYASRYGYSAFGFAIMDMIKNNEIHITQEMACSLWEYGGSGASLD